MNTEAIMERVRQLGVVISLSPPDTIRITGKESAVVTIKPVIREHKGAILALLRREDGRGKEQPYIDGSGLLRIPLDCKHRYKWWDGGQSILDTLLELKAPCEVIARYIDPIHQPISWKKLQSLAGQYPDAK